MLGQQSHGAVQPISIHDEVGAVGRCPGCACTHKRYGDSKLKHAIELRWSVTISVGFIVKHSLTAISVLICATLLPFSAYAGGWQSTQWGMSLPQTVAASRGAAVPLTDQEEIEGQRKEGYGSPKLRMPYASGEFNFTAFFYFRDEKLAEVSLKLASGDPNSLVGALRGKYGKEFHLNESGFLKIHTWRHEGDQVSLTIIGSSASVAYHPLLNDSNKGL